MSRGWIHGHRDCDSGDNPRMRLRRPMTIRGCGEKLKFLAFGGGREAQHDARLAEAGRGRQAVSSLIGSASDESTRFLSARRDKRPNRHDSVVSYDPPIIPLSAPGRE
jgi:hypothetical protein